MNRRNFFTRTVAALALAPFLKPALAQAKPEVPVLAGEPTRHQTRLILGRLGMGKTMLANFMVKGVSKSVLFDSNMNDADRWPEWQKARLQWIQDCRARGMYTVITGVLNKVAFLKQGYGGGPSVTQAGALPMGLMALADWTFVIVGKSFVQQPGNVAYAWRCVTLKDRWGDRPEKFTYVARVGQEGLEIVPFHIDGWDNNWT